MILVNKNGENIKISGHSLYDDFGKDIVCSSVSSIVITTINGILEIDNSAIKYTEKDGLEIEILKKDRITSALINNMMLLLKELSLKYPKNLKIKEGV